MFRSFIKVTALSLILMSTFFLIKGALGLSLKDIVELSTIPYGGYSDKLVQNFTQQKSDTIVGFVLILLAFTLSLIDLLMPTYCDELTMNRKGLIGAIVVSIVIFLVAYGTSSFLQKKWSKEVHAFHSAGRKVSGMSRWRQETEFEYRESSIQHALRKQKAC